jgi:hypothetical protein
MKFFETIHNRLCWTKFDETVMAKFSDFLLLHLWVQGTTGNYLYTPSCGLVATSSSNSTLQRGCSFLMCICPSLVLKR